MVVVHKKCIVQSYLQWLKDSDYDPNCTLCGSNLETDDCVRLTCYHVFHFKCLNDRQSKLPINTAPGGHTCPICKSGIFPPSNLVSPVADALRHRLSQVNWGRNELGLPLFTDTVEYSSPSPAPSNDGVANGAVVFKNVSQGQGHHLRTNITTENKVLERSESPHSVLNIENYSSSRPLLQQREPTSVDRDENKYKRKTPQEIFSRWSRRLYSPAARPPWRRTWFIVLMGFLIFFSIIYLMYVFGRHHGYSEENDMLAMKNNPNLHYE
jgi:hypothetical protein